MSFNSKFFSLERIYNLMVLVVYKGIGMLCRVLW